MTVCVKLNVWLQDGVSQSYGVHLVGVSHSLLLPGIMKQAQAKLLTFDMERNYKCFRGCEKTLANSEEEAEFSSARNWIV